MKTKAVLLSFAFALLMNDVSAQTYNDGPTQLMIRVREINVTYSPPADASLTLGGQFGFNPDELTFKIWARDNPNLSGLNWQGGTCLTDEFDPPAASADLNTQLFSFTYPTAVSPAFFDIRLDAWQDNCGSDGVGPINCGGQRCNFENRCSDFACGTIAGVGDNRRCNADPFLTGVDYRAAGPPCQWNSHGFLPGNCPSNNFYQPRMETFWRYMKGTACTPNDAIDLGAMASGTTLTHFNSNTCYNNNFANSPGNDVFYKFSVTGPIGIDVNLCDNSTLLDTYVYLLDGNCNVIESNDDGAGAGCGNRSLLSYSICVPGDYYVVVDGKNANSNGPFLLTIQENTAFSFTASIIKTDPSCTGFADGSATVSARPLNPAYTFLWTPTGGTDSTITDLAAGNYSVVVTNPVNNCTVSASTTLIDPPSMIIDSIVTTDLSCSGQNDGTARVYVSGGTPPYINYTWDNGMQGNVILGLPAGTYSVIISDLEGCTVSSDPSNSAVITATNPIVIDVTDYSDISCFGANDGFINTDVSGGNAPYSYSWVPGNFTTSSVSGLPKGNITLTVFDATGNGDQCFEIRTFNIFEPDLLIATINATRNVTCFGGDDGAVDLGVSGGTLPYSYQWSDGSDREDLLGSPADTVSVSVTDANQCTANTIAIITAPPVITSTITVLHPAGCHGENDGELDLQVSGGDPSYTYIWSNNETTEDITGLAAGNYQVVIIDSRGCPHVNSQSIPGFPELVVVPQVSNPPCIGKDNGKVSLTVIGEEPFTFLWSNGFTDAAVDSLAPGSYSVTVTDANNCTAEASAVVDEATFNCEGAIMDVAIPNIFSPNGDGRNDFFDIYAADDVSRINVKIFNRWGAKVYENPNQMPNMIGQGWDGKINSKDAQLGAYTYVIEIEYSTPMTTDRPVQKTGTITVVR